MQFVRNTTWMSGRVPVKDENLSAWKKRTQMIVSAPVAEPKFKYWPFYASNLFRRALETVALGG